MSLLNYLLTDLLWNDREQPGYIPELYGRHSGTASVDYWPTSQSNRGQLPESRSQCHILYTVQYSVIMSRDAVSRSSFKVKCHRNVTFSGIEPPLLWCLHVNALLKSLLGNY